MVQPLWDSMAGSNKSKGSVEVQSSSHVPKYIPNKFETISGQKYTHECL